MENKRMKKKKNWQRISLIIILGLLSVAVIAFFYIKSVTYGPTTQAVEAAKFAENKKRTLVFKGNPEKPAVIFYQGAFVENASYSIWANKVAKAGFSVYLAQQPLNLAVLGPNEAQKIIKSERISNYVIGGHSLGGVMSSRFAVSDQENQGLKGVFFLASYPDEKGSLRSFKGETLSVVGSEDGVLNWEAYESAKENLPTQTVFETIIGGNHAGFGSYGEQKGDKPAKINNQEQQNQVGTILINWLETLE